MSRLLRDAWFQMFAGIAALCLVIMAVDWLGVHGATRTPLDVAREVASSVTPEPEPAPPPAEQAPPAAPRRDASPLPIPPQDHDARTPSPAGRASPKEPGSWLVSLFPGPRIDTTSLADAVARAKNGDTIRLRPGRYLEAVATNGKSLLIKGEGTRPEDVVLESAQPITLSVTKGSVVLENITISHRKDAAAPFAGRSAAIFVSGAKLVLKNAAANGWGAALQAAQDQDPAVIEASSSRLSGTIADLLVRGKARVDFKDVTFNNTLQPIVAWRDVDLLLRACRFPATAGTRLYVYGNSRARFADMERSPRVVSERAADAARADETAFSTAGEAAAPAAQNAPLRMIRRGGLQKWKKDIFGRKTR